jgi:hypothetical protein
MRPTLTMLCKVQPSAHFPYAVFSSYSLACFRPIHYVYCLILASSTSPQSVSSIIPRMLVFSLRDIIPLPELCQSVNICQEKESVTHFGRFAVIKPAHTHPTQLLKHCGKAGM